MDGDPEPVADAPVVGDRGSQSDLPGFVDREQSRVLADERVGQRVTVRICRGDRFADLRACARFIVHSAHG